jgi:HAMP domain-containing protein
MRRHLPGFFTIANLGISTKLGLIVVVLALPIAALLFVQYQQRTDTQDQANAEAVGLDYVSAIIPFLREVQVHRGLVQRVLSGDEFSRDNMVRTAAAADSALAVINELDSRHGKDFQTSALVEFLNTEWPKVKDAKSSAIESNDAHTRIIQQGIFPLLSTVAIESKLVLDPDLDSRSVIVALTDSLPRLTEALSQSRSYGTAALISRQGLPATAEQKQFLTAQMSIASAHADALARSLETAMTANPDFEETLRPIVRRSETSRSVFADSTVTGIIDAGALSTTGAEGYFLLGGSAIDLSNQLVAAAQETLDAQFTARTDAAQQEFITYGGAAVLVVLFALALAVFISATITRPLKHLAEVADRMSLGELDVDIDVEGRNEVGQLAESLRRMQASLRSAIERLRQRRAAA